MSELGRLSIFLITVMTCKNWIFDFFDNHNSIADLFFRFIADTKSKREKNLKPCSKTSQFSTALHSQAHKRRQTELVTGFSRSHGNVQQVQIIILSLIAIKAYIQFCQSVVMLCSFNLY
jgi:hypothetical protein